MTLISVVLHDVIYSKQFLPGDNLTMSLSRALGGAESKVCGDLTQQRVVYSGSNVEVPQSNMQQRAVGAENMTIIAVATEHQRISKVEDQLRTLQAVVEPLAAHRLRVVSSEILLHAVERHGFYETSTNYFAMMGSHDERIQSVSATLNVDAARLVEQSDQIICRRNGQVHPSTVERLEMEIREVMGMIAGFPGLSASCKWECIIVNGYEAFKAAFPDRFK